MLDQDTARALITVADEAVARVALIGDRHQLPAVGRGGVLELAHRWVHPRARVDLDMVHRFVRTLDGVTVLDLRGSLMAGMGLEALSPRIQQLVADKKLKIVLNAQDVSVIDSSGVGDMVGSFSLVKRSGGALKIANPSKLVRDVLQIARIPTIIEVHETEAGAINSFGK